MHPCNVRECISNDSPFIFAFAKIQIVTEMELLFYRITRAVERERDMS